MEDAAPEESEQARVHDQLYKNKSDEKGQNSTATSFPSGRIVFSVDRKTPPAVAVGPVMYSRYIKCSLLVRATNVMSFRM